MEFRILHLIFILKIVITINEFLYTDQEIHLDIYLLWQISIWFILEKKENTSQLVDNVKHDPSVVLSRSLSKNYYDK